MTDIFAEVSVYGRLLRKSHGMCLLLHCLRAVIGPRPKIARWKHFSAKIRGTRPPTPPPTRRQRPHSGSSLHLSPSPHAYTPCHPPRLPAKSNLFITATTSMTWCDSMRPFLPLSGIATALPTRRASKSYLEMSRPTRSSLTKMRRRTGFYRASPVSTRRTRM